MDDKERLERRVYLNLLYDFYSPLLTERQRNVYEMLYFSDLAPAEVARSLGISRQAVHILERRVMERLEVIEEELHFAGTTRRLEERIRELEEENRALRGGGDPGRTGKEATTGV
ncbi:MAG: DNA-binding protein [Fretibacterium sp.]|nr:DNA-binding protein [Fretibacterium sp.]